MHSHSCFTILMSMKMTMTINTTTSEQNHPSVLRIMPWPRGQIIYFLNAVVLGCFIYRHYQIRDWSQSTSHLIINSISLSWPYIRTYIHIYITNNRWFAVVGCRALHHWKEFQFVFSRFFLLLCYFHTRMTACLPFFMSFFRPHDRWPALSETTTPKLTNTDKTIRSNPIRSVPRRAKSGTRPVYTSQVMASIFIKFSRAVC